MSVTTELVRASEIPEKVFQRIWDIRTGEDRKRAAEKYEADLAAYQKAKGKRQEITITTAAIKGGFDIQGERYGQVEDRKIFGFFKRDGVTFVPRPIKPASQEKPSRIWHHSKRERIGSTIHPARTYGLLGNSLFNRDIRPERVLDYAFKMEAGEWVDLPSDPISITADGQVLNGQHRLAAIEMADGFKGTDPLFLIIWGVDPKEALYTDGSCRTANDQKTIAVKLVKPKAA